MWADGLLMQERRTKRKWKLIWMLLAAALLSLGGAWLAEHPREIKGMAAEVRGRMLPKRTEEWIALPAGGIVQAVTGDAMICTAPGRLYAAGLDGTLLWEREIGLEEPVVRRGDGFAAVYGPGETELLIAGRADCVSISVPRGVDLAAVGPDGQAAVVTAGSGYLTETDIFSPEGALERSAGLTGSAMTMMAFLEDGTLAACCVDTGGRWTLRLDSGAEVLEVPLEDTLVYDIQPCGGGAALWTCDGVRFFDLHGRETGGLALNGEAVLDFACGDFAALTMYESGGYCLRLLSPDGMTESVVPLPGKPMMLTVCDKLACLLDRESLLVYDEGGTLRRRSPLGARAGTVYGFAGRAVLTGDGYFLLHDIS